MQAAIEFEVARQVAVLEQGGEVVMETRLWDEKKKCTISMRKKEGQADYRYFPEPDLPPLVLTESEVESARAALPELPAARRVRYAAMGLPLETVLTLTDEAATGLFFDAALAAGGAPKAVANYLVGDVMAYCKEQRVRGRC